MGHDERSRDVVTSPYDPEWDYEIGFLDPDDPKLIEAVHRARLLIDADPATVETIFGNVMAQTENVSNHEVLPR